MPNLSKRARRLKQYGNTQIVIPVLISDTRYSAFKRLILGQGKNINKVTRDLIEEAYGEQLDEIEQVILLESGEQESA